MTTPNLHDGRFARTEYLLGPEAFARLKRSFVCVIGLGAVGSYATEALARAGVGHLRLVDFDEVRLSNINRQLYALQSTLGKKKVAIARERVLQINPQCRVDALETFVHQETFDAILADRPNLVIDAIDSFTPKVMLLTELHRRGIRVISSMGAALRSDPMLIRIGPLGEVHTCPLAARLRKALRAKGASVDLTCVYSIEPPRKLAPWPTDPGSTTEGETLSRGRSRKVLGSLPTLTGIFGLMAANTAIEMLTSGEGASI